MDRKDIKFVEQVVINSRIPRRVFRYASIIGILRSYKLGSLMDLVGKLRGEIYHRTKALECADYFKAHLRFPQQGTTLGAWYYKVRGGRRGWDPLLLDEVFEPELGFKPTQLSRGVHMSLSSIAERIQAAQAGTEVPRRVRVKWREAIMHPHGKPGTAQALTLLKEHIPPELAKQLWAPNKHPYRGTNLCSRGHERTSENTYVYPSSDRHYCRLCHNIAKSHKRRKK